MSDESIGALWACPLVLAVGDGGDRLRVNGFSGTRILLGADGSLVESVDALGVGDVQRERLSAYGESLEVADCSE